MMPRTVVHIVHSVKHQFLSDEIFNSIDVVTVDAKPACPFLFSHKHYRDNHAWGLLAMPPMPIFVCRQLMLFLI